MVEGVRLINTDCVGVKVEDQIWCQVEDQVEYQAKDRVWFKVRDKVWWEYWRFVRVKAWFKVLR